jgi:hypothetical protein
MAYAADDEPFPDDPNPPLLAGAEDEDEEDDPRLKEPDDLPELPFPRVNERLGLLPEFPFPLKLREGVAVR